MNPACQDNKPITLAFAAQSGTDYYIRKIITNNTRLHEGNPAWMAQVMFIEHSREPFEDAIGLTTNGLETIVECALVGPRGVPFDQSAASALAALYFDGVRRGDRLYLPPAWQLVFLPRSVATRHLAEKGFAA